MTVLLRGVAVMLEWVWQCCLVDVAALLGVCCVSAGGTAERPFLQSQDS